MESRRRENDQREAVWSREARLVKLRNKSTSHHKKKRNKNLTNKTNPRRREARPLHLKERRMWGGRRTAADYWHLLALLLYCHTILCTKIPRPACRLPHRALVCCVSLQPLVSSATSGIELVLSTSHGHPPLPPHAAHRKQQPQQANTNTGSV